MKDNSTSERSILEKIENITLIPGRREEKFSFWMTEEEKRECAVFYARQLKKVAERVKKEHYDVLFLDESIYAVRAGLLDERQLALFLDEKPEALEVILTGQGPGEELLKRADYVSEICMRKHPFQRGIRARGGIEQ